MIARPASCLGSNPVKSQFRQIKLINKDIDHPNRIVLIDPVFQAFGKQCALLAIRALNEAFHPTSVAAKNQRCENHTKEGVFTQPGSKAEELKLSKRRPL